MNWLERLLKIRDYYQVHFFSYSKMRGLVIKLGLVAENSLWSVEITQIAQKLKPNPPYVTRIDSIFQNAL